MSAETPLQFILRIRKTSHQDINDEIDRCLPLMFPVWNPMTGMITMPPESRVDSFYQLRSDWLDDFYKTRDCRMVGSDSYDAGGRRREYNCNMEHRKDMQVLTLDSDGKWIITTPCKLCNDKSIFR
jgi:hypothetical protein